MNYDKFLARNHALNIDLNEERTLIQNIRSFIFRKFNIWDLWDLFPYGWRMTYYDKIKPIYNPSNKRLRKFIPRTWQDFSNLMVDLNFEIIKTFYEDEYTAGIVDWDSDQPHRDFSKWLDSSYFYITKARPKLDIDLQNSYPLSKPIEEMFERIPQEDGTTRMYLKDDGIPYEIKYAEVNRIEKLIEETDTKILKEFIEYRQFFWT
jgi:hypothetical protein